AAGVPLREPAARLSPRSAAAIDRMEEIVQAVRRAHKSGSVEAPRQPLKLSDEIEVALALFEDRLAAISVVKRYQPGLIGCAPHSDLQHVLWNLIDNAI